MEKEVCAVCLEEAVFPVKLACPHVLCRECLAVPSRITAPNGSICVSFSTLERIYLVSVSDLVTIESVLEEFKKRSH